MNLFFASPLTLTAAGSLTNPCGSNWLETLLVANLLSVIILGIALVKLRANALLQHYTERKQTELILRQREEQLETERKLLEAVLHQMPAGVVIAEAPSGKTILGNQQVEEIFRHPYYVADDIEQYQQYRGLHPDGQPYRPQDWPLARTVITGEVVNNEEIQILRGDGSEGTILISSAPIRKPQGEVTAAVASFMDISDRKQQEVERKQSLDREQAARAEAERASRVKDEFLAIVSHELRAPLNAILGWAKLLRSREFDPATMNKALATIERNAEAQSQLIEDLLDISRIIRGQVKLECQALPLETVIEAAIETVRPATRNKQIQLKFENRFSKAAVWGDRDRLQQIIWNLITNAVKFTPEGGRVAVRLDRQEGDTRQEEKGKGQNEQEQNGQDSISAPEPSAFHPLPSDLFPEPSAYDPQPSALITVTDTGKGINPEFLPYVFDRFRQAEGATTRTTNGLGLGLAIVKSLVELHGGAIAVTSEGKDRGATFTVTLPLLSSSPVTTSPVTTEVSVESEQALSLQGVAVLAVDDEVDTREYLATVLQLGGAKVRTAASAVEAIALVRQWQPDLIISDIGMPLEDGYELIRQLRQLPQGESIPAIALTAFARDDDRQRALAAGFTLHLAKPIVPASLLAAVNQLVISNHSHP